MTKPTQGNWYVEKTPNAYLVESEYPRRLIATCRLSGLSASLDSEALANANLIASSKEMREALDKILDAIEGVLGPDKCSLNYVWDVAHAALAKAKGEQK